METQNLKNLWNEFKDLEPKQTTHQNLQIMISKSSKTKISEMYHYEIINGIVMIIIAALLVYTILIAPQHTAMMVSLYIGLFITLAGSIVQLRKLMLLKSFNYSKDALATVSLKLLKLKLWLKKERTVQFILFPPYLFIIFVATIYLVQQQNLFEMIEDYLPRIIFAILLASAITPFVYKDSFRKIRKIENEMQELNNLMKE